MMLMVDAGNTAVKWGLCEAGEIVTTGRIVYRGCDIAEQLNRSWTSLQQPAAVYVANVAGEDMANALSAWARQRWSLTPEFISSSGAACGVTNAYPVAENLGVDRWVALIAAHHHFHDAVCIVDCGTAITVDKLAADGRHLGGMILPGIDMLEQAVREGTAGVSSSAEVQSATLLASSTEGSVHSGAVYMAVAAIDRVISDLADTQDQKFEVVITGGDASKILTLLARPARHDPELVLKGLAILAGGH